MPVPKLWIFFFVAVTVIILAIFVSQPDASVQTGVLEESTIEDTRGTTFTTMLEKGGNAIYVEDQLSETLSVRVGFVVLSAPGFVVIFNDAGGVPGVPIGMSDFLTEGGEHLAVPLEESLQEGQIYYAMLYLDDGNGEFSADTDTQAADSEDSVVLMSFLASHDADPESEAVSP
ncbi:MAG: hypothetical protein WC654_05225 [Patescibacteria group bacterium]